MKNLTLPAALFSSPEAIVALRSHLSTVLTVRQYLKDKYVPMAFEQPDEDDLERHYARALGQLTAQLDAVAPGVAESLTGTPEVLSAFDTAFTAAFDELQATGRCPIAHLALKALRDVSREEELAEVIALLPTDPSVKIDRKLDTFVYEELHDLIGDVAHLVPAPVIDVALLLEGEGRARLIRAFRTSHAA